jgi:hypothetical protein
MYSRTKQAVAQGGEVVMMAMLASQLLGYRVATPGILV